MKPGLRLRVPLPVGNNITPAAATGAKTNNISRLHQTLSLPDGRRLGYAEYGSPTGYPILYFHGFPSSRLEGWAVDGMARRRGLRVIAPDRPGYGLSTFQKQRRITDWPADVKSLVDHLRIPRFAVLGGSGGGPYAVACAYALPYEMLSAVGILAGAGPWAAGMRYVSRTRRMLSCAATNSPAALRVFVDGVVGASRWCATSGPVTKWLDAWLEKQESRDETTLSTEEERERLLKTLFEAFAQGAGASVQEAVLLSHDWGFRFEDVPYNRIQIWHGEKDANSPVEMTRYLAARLPHCSLREFAGETHYTLIKHLEEILGELVTEEMIQQHSALST
ncbi:hypothetical protein P175DRAFT_0503915 [Aspergillus ochraceoroseus IBT 24754]|uniref:AB hydrolase-1 domain-containing protein n=3 Tax=Aspergillus subgen. Nidulantes TaxID=2720870 RepID=A0A0F8URK1_9EURO|nr:uncharacterized protein P175DRAFT_0503915 [Aspergillus ochraceoroseus IBT 24754]KKK13481.1 hypothetical protein ARAM_003889 [Aspergillus rambellii]KKK19418.1 hypothetical protein AOCH_001337 [Aspergillus ochraceoroseus]PTU18033.1 hypothetical protein P175DRAFT_0503915 [Aspergillus ochraceoroseus IBT 24754]